MATTIDLRSDTVTRPSQAMRRAMADAEVGNESYGEDPTILELEQRAVELTGMAAALFVTSGKQGNLTAVLAHCERSDGVVVGRESHIHFYEGRGVTLLSGVQLLVVDDAGGVPAPDAIDAACEDAACRHAPPTLLCLENTHNRVGGVAVPPDVFAHAADAGRRHGLAVHLDGARLFDAAVRWGEEASAYTQQVDSVQICLTKSLGAPLGSILCGPKEFIAEARTWRDRLGGGFRQAGIVGAAGLIALDEMRLRLHEDHEKAERLADLLKAGGLPVEEHPWRTNMVFVNLGPDAAHGDVIARCNARGVLAGAMEPGRLRLVTHVDISHDDIGRAARAILDSVRG